VCDCPSALTEVLEMHKGKLDPHNTEEITNFVAEVLNVNDIRIVQTDEEE
jgi:hypothetical protein